MMRKLTITYHIELGPDSVEINLTPKMTVGEIESLVEATVRSKFEIPEGGKVVWDKVVWRDPEHGRG
jgi:hypothetical protein